MIKVLALGDVVGSEAVNALTSGGLMNTLRKKYSADFIIINGENASDSNGLTLDDARRLYSAGADVITGGNHTFKWNEIYNLLDDNTYAIRPANYPPSVPGMGYVISDCNGYGVLVMNLIGTVFMDPMNSPIECAEKILSREEGNYDVAICDFHAEATSEKLCFARYFDGKISAVFGTHTHIPTADAKVLPSGTGYITDLGMCGSDNGILGVRTEDVMKKYVSKLPSKFTRAKGNLVFQGALFTIDTSNGKCVKAERIDA